MNNATNTHRTHRSRNRSGTRRTYRYQVALPNGTVRPANYPLVVAHSPIDGVGVFSLGTIQEGARIAEWVDGIELPYAEMKRLYSLPSGKIDWRYTYRRMPWNTQICNKAWAHRNISNFVNDGVHGQQEPNVNVYHQARWLRAARDIAPGEELLLDYGTAYW
jgi:SET domain-containing protein